MKKKWLIVLVVAGLLAVLAVPAVVLAQSGATGGYPPAYSGLWDLSAQNRVAELLGISSTDLQTQLQGGATLQGLAAAKNVSSDVLVAAILAPQKDMLDLQVKYGRLTAEQAQQALEALTASAQVLVQATFAGSTSGTWSGGYCPMMGGAYGSDDTVPGFNRFGGIMGGGMMGGRGMMGGWR